MRRGKRERERDVAGLCDFVEVCARVLRDFLRAFARVRETDVFACFHSCLERRVCVCVCVCVCVLVRVRAFGAFSPGFRSNCATCEFC